MKRSRHDEDGDASRTAPKRTKTALARPAAARVDDRLRRAFPLRSEEELERVGTAQSRAFWAMYSGPFKLTPAYLADPIHALPFGGRGMMTQKMDGMYMLWDPKAKQMYNRGRGSSSSAANRPQHPPPSFHQQLPAVELEGELCFSTGEYSRGHSAKLNGWKNACLFVWDAPLHPGPYHERFQYVTQLLKGYDSRFVRPVPFLGVATSRRVLDATLAKVRATVVPRTFAQGFVGASYEGGEGVMVRDPDAPYTHSCFEPRHGGHKKGQTTSLYKWLEEFGNDECRVLRTPAQTQPLAVEPVAVAAAVRGGKASARRSRRRPEAMATTGTDDGQSTLWVALPNGTEFALKAIARLGMPARDVPVGSVITFTYTGWTDGRPVRPAAQAFRTDRTWDDLVDNFIPPPTLEHGLVTARVRRTKSLQPEQMTGLVAAA